MRIVVTGGSGKGGRVGRARPARARPRRPQRRRPARRQRLRAVHGRRPDRPRADPGRPGRRRRRRPFRGDPGPAAPARGRDVPDQRALDLQRLRGRGRAPDPARRLGVERDRARPAVRPAAGLRADRRDASSRGRRRPTRSRSSSARRWRPSSRGGAGSGSSACGSRTSWSRRTTRRSRRTGTTRSSASGTCGATSTRGTSPQAARLGLEAEVEGAEVAIVAAADTVMTRPSVDLMAEVFPPCRSGGPSTDARPCSRSTTPGRSSATSRRTAGRTTSRPDVRADRRRSRILGRCSDDRTGARHRQLGRPGPARRRTSPSGSPARTST